MDFHLPKRSKNANKGDFGHVLIVGGDYGMGGSVLLAGEAALRTGAGLVSIATRPEHAYAIMGNCPELMCHGIQEAQDLDNLLKKATVVVIGPGLGQNTWGRDLLTLVLKSSLPLVVDADALNLLAASKEQEQKYYKENWILTPHPGEAARLLGIEVSEIQSDRVKAAIALQNRFGGVIVLKGAGTVVLGKEQKLQVCSRGNPGMASGGMGDLLSGVIAGLLAQKLPLQDAAHFGVFVHARAGDKAAKKGERGMIARDLLEYIRECLNL
jgi:hydroxyethylthiazole kinase-like uncharacterized protein yjeF